MWSFLIFFLVDIILKLNIAIIKKGNVIYVFKLQDYQSKRNYNEKIFKDIFFLDLAFLFLIYYTINLESILIFVSFCAVSLIKL